MVSVGPGCGAEPPLVLEGAVVACAIFESPPNTAFRVSVPRNATSWNPYVVLGWSPRTVHVRTTPITLPVSGVAHVPRVTVGNPPHEIGATPKRDRKSTRLNSSHLVISYAVFCLKKKKKMTLTYYSYQNTNNKKKTIM